MFLTARVIRLISRQVVRAEGEDCNNDREAALQAAGLIAKALAIAGAAYGLYWAAKSVLSPIAEMLGNEYPALEDTPVIGPVLKALGPQAYDPEAGPGHVEGADQVEPESSTTITELAQAPTVEAGKAEAAKPPAVAAGAPEPTYTPVMMPPPKPGLAVRAGKQLARVQPGEAFYLDPKHQSLFLSKEEAASFTYLRSVGANFGVGRGIPPALLTLIQTTAARYAKDGVRADWMLAMAQMESGGNPYAISSTGAIGIYQFTNGTGKDYKLKNRFDQVENVDAGARLMRDNIKYLTPRLNKLGVQVDLNSVYLAHQQGRGGAVQLYSVAAGRDKMTPGLAKAMGQNYGEMGAQQYIDKNKALMASKAKQSQQIDGWTNYVALDPSKAATTTVAQAAPAATLPITPVRSATPPPAPAKTATPAAQPTAKRIGTGELVLAPGNIVARL